MTEPVTVLVVDDEPPIRRFLRTSLSAQGYRVLEAEAGGEALELVKEIYAEAVGRFDELCAPYLSVVLIDRDKLPAVSTVKGWSSERFMRALRHDQRCPDYDKQFRQLVHIAFKVAAGKGAVYLRALEQHADVIGKNVTENIYNRHVKPLFLG